MTRKEAERLTRQANQLRALGFTADEAEALRRISLTLHRWHELECGDSNAYGSWAIERDENGDGPPFMVRHHYAHGHGKDRTTRTPIADRERGAMRRLEAIVKARNMRQLRALSDEDSQHRRASAEAEERALKDVAAYVQTDPRGCALYILRPGDVPSGGDPSAYYSRGIAVY